MSGIDSFEAGELLASLVDKSLVVFDEDSDRYRVSETVRQYARDRLVERDEAKSWRYRHSAYFLHLAEAAAPQLVGRDQKAWLDRLEQEHDNFRAAMEWCSDDSALTELGLRLASALWRFWWVRGYITEGRIRLNEALTYEGEVGKPVRAVGLNAAGILAAVQADYSTARQYLTECLAISAELGDSETRARSLRCLGVLAKDQGDYPAAQSHWEESLAIYRQIGDLREIALDLSNLGGFLGDQGDYLRARKLLEESIAINRELGDLVTLGAALANLGEVAEWEGDNREARLLGKESLAIRRALGDRAGTAHALSNLGRVSHALEDYKTALAFHEESLSIRRDIGDRSGIAVALEGVATALAKTGGVLHAAKLWGAAERLRELIGAPLNEKDRARYEHDLANARASQLDNTAFDACFQEGRALNLEVAIELALQEFDS